MANTCGKSLSQEGERRLVESLPAARLRLFDTPTADILRRLFGERRLVNGAPQRRDETTGRDFESDGGCPTGYESRTQVRRFRWPIAPGPGSRTGWCAQACCKNRSDG